MTDHTTHTDARSTTGLLSDAVAQVTGLVRKEVDLVRAELSENASKAAVAIGLIAGGAVVALVALNVLSAALVAGLARLMAGEGADEATLASMTGWAALIIGVLYIIVAAIMVRKGTGDLKASSLAPTRSAESVRRDALAVKETFDGQR